MFRNKIGMPALTSSIQYFTWGSSQYNQVMKRNKMLQIVNDEVQLSLFWNYVIYKENLVKSTKKTYYN